MATLQVVLHSYAERSEREFLQPLFDRWKERTIAVAGAPRWLLDVDVENTPQRTFAAYGYKFSIDVLWRLKNERRVVELKDALKWEPMALAEVLHHAHLFNLLDGGAGDVKPTVIGRYNSWSRGALEYLFEHKFNRTRIEYLEFDHLADESGEKHYLWFDDPFEPWESTSCPAELRPWARDGWDHWYYIDKTKSWICTEKEVGAARPVFMPGPYKMIASIAGAPGEYLEWEGLPPPLRSDAKHNWKCLYRHIKL